jgi:hypothetical protein
MTTRSTDPNEIGSMFASDAVAAQWQSGRAQREKVNAAANEMLLDLANLRPGNRVLDVAGFFSKASLRRRVSSTPSFMRLL